MDWWLRHQLALFLYSLSYRPPATPKKAHTRIFITKCTNQIQ
jgi:hypothetical protein